MIVRLAFLQIQLVLLQVIFPCHQQIQLHAQLLQTGKRPCKELHLRRKWRDFLLLQLIHDWQTLHATHVHSLLFHQEKIWLQQHFCDNPANLVKQKIRILTFNVIWKQIGTNRIHYKHINLNDKDVIFVRGSRFVFMERIKCKVNNENIANTQHVFQYFIFENIKSSRKTEN